MNTSHKFVRIAITLIGIFSILFSALQIQPMPVAAQGNDGDIQRNYNTETGKVTHISGTGDEPITLMGAMSADMNSAERSDVLVERFAPEFGLTQPSEELIVADESQPSANRVVTKYQQVYQGVPVLGGELIVNASDTGSLYSMNGEVSQGLSLDTAPAISNETAIDIAKQGMTKWYGGSKADYQSTTASLYIFDESILRPSVRPVELVWKIEMTSTSQGEPIRELVLVSAKSGNIPLHFNQVDTGWDDTQAEPIVQYDDPASTATATPLPTEIQLYSTPTVINDPDSTTYLQATNTNIEINSSANAVVIQSANNRYVSTSGSDVGDCTSLVSPCLTINYALNASLAGDFIFVAAGLYTGSGGNVVTISKSITLSGGWQDNYTSQKSVSIIDGQNTRNGILSSSSTNNVIVDRFVITNSTSSDSGGIYIYGGNFTLKNSSVVNNSAGNRGGGIFLINGPLVYVINSTISGNRAGSSGGGIYISSGAATIQNSTIANNTADSGGGLFVSNIIISIQNTIIANNFGTSGGPDCMGDIGFSSSIVKNMSDCTASARSGTGNQFNIDPKMDGILTGAIPVHALLADSPAIDTGNQALCQLVDERGMPRPFANGCDIGAYEYAPNGGLFLISGSKQTASMGATFSLPLTAILVDGDVNPISGATIQFTAPASGPSAMFIDTGTYTMTATTDANGKVSSSNLTANNLFGSYTVNATATGYPNTIAFQLNNKTNGNWYVSNTGNDADSCADLTHPCLTIQAAIYKASFGDTIKVATGTYTGSSGEVVGIASNVNLSGGWNNTFTVQEGMSIIDGQNKRRGITTTSLAISTISHFIIQKGTAIQGGGIYNYGTLTLDTCEVVHNNATNNGSSIGGEGGGIYNNGSLILNNCLIDDNHATWTGYVGVGGNGGGILNLGLYAYGDPSLIINNTVISNNTATCSNNATSSCGGEGGGLLAGGESVNINDSSIIGNSSLLGGGIIASANLNMKRSAIVNNRSMNEGGGIYSGGNLDLTNITISNNTGKSSGGGIYIYNGTATINNSTITQNIAADPNETAIGGGLSNYYNKPVTIRNTIIAGNGADIVPDCRGQITSGSYNLIGYGDGCLITSTTGDQIGALGAPLNAKLGNLLDNGGPTITHALLTGSPAIDAGDPATCATTDQRGITRPQGAACDIGAFEGSVPQTLSPVIRTYTAEHSNAIPGTLVCDQPTSCASAIPEANSAHQFALGTYNFYLNQFGRNGIDNNNLPILSTVRYENGYKNAFWTGAQMVIGDGYGFANADDIVAHELTHGVTQYESNLFYVYQSGAINESLSDLFGEYYDQTNGLGNDSSTVKWLLGEDVAGWTNLAPKPPLGQRSMSNPPAFGHPDKISSTYYYKGEDDNGGVHRNSGVNNKAAYLMVEGGTFNGQTIKALGWEKTAAIYYEAQVKLLGAASNYSDLYYALQQACVNLGFSKDVCSEVKKALDAVQMNTPVTGATSNQISAPLCPTGMTTTANLTSFAENFDDANEAFDPSSWTKMSEIYTSPTSAMNTLGGNGVFQTLTMKDGILIQPGSYLHFHHAYDFEVYKGANYDGGVVEYSLDNGNTWVDAGTLFSAGAPYTGTLATYAINPNPLQGRRAFTGTNFPYYLSPTHMVSSRFDLNKLANKMVKFRFAYGTDMAEYWRGWFIDDVKIYQCIGTPAIPVLQAPLTNALITDYTPYLNWSDATPALHYYQLQIATNNNFSTLVYDKSDLVTSEFKVPTDLPANATYYWHVRSYNAIDGTFGWSTTWSFRTALPPSVLVTPNEGDAFFSLRPTFDWEDVAEAGVTGYTIQISTSNTFATIANTSNPVASTYTPTVDLPKGKLYWRVRANGTNGPSAWTTRSYQGPNAPAAPVLSLPANNALVTDYTPLFKWSALTLPAGAAPFDHYQLQVATDTGFTAIVLDENISGVTNNTFTPTTDLAPNTKYYWHVRGVNSLPENGAWSAMWNFRTVLLPVTLNTLPNGDHPSMLKPTFTWTDPNVAPLATSYSFQISAVSSFSTLVTSGTASTPSYTPSLNLPAGKTLYWRVRANGTNGPSLWTTGNFTSPTPPSVSTLSLPANNSLSTTYTPTLKWSVVTSTAIVFDHYQVQVDDDPLFGSPEVDDVSHTLASLNTLTTAALPHNTKFYGRVLAFNTAGQYSTSAVWSFRTALLPVTLEPLQNGETLKPKFTWTDANAAPLPTSYTIQIAASNTFATLITSGTTTAGVTSFIPSINLPAGKTLYWRVRANGVNGPSLWTAGSFTTPTPPSVSTLSLPANNALSTTYTPTLKWSVVTSTAVAFDHYQVQVDDDPLFGSPEVEDVSHTLASQNTLTTHALAHNIKFYWRVLAFNTVGQYSTSTVWSFRTLADAPNLLTPDNGAPAGSLKPTFTWNAPTGPVTSYTIQVATTPTFTTLLVNSSTVDSSYTRLTNLPAGKTLYWRVRVNGPNGPSAWSTIFSFMTP